MMYFNSPITLKNSDIFFNIYINKIYFLWLYYNPPIGFYIGIKHEHA